MPRVHGLDTTQRRRHGGPLPPSPSSLSTTTGSSGPGTQNPNFPTTMASRTMAQPPLPPMVIPTASRGGGGNGKTMMANQQAQANSAQPAPVVHYSSVSNRADDDEEHHAGAKRNMMCFYAMCFFVLVLTIFFFAITIHIMFPPRQWNTNDLLVAMAVLLSMAVLWRNFQIQGEMRNDSLQLFQYCRRIDQNVSQLGNDVSQLGNDVRQLGNDVSQLLQNVGQYNAPMPSNNSDSDDDRYGIVGCGAAGQPATGPLRSATRL